MLVMGNSAITEVLKDIRDMHDDQQISSPCEKITDDLFCEMLVKQ